MPRVLDDPVDPVTAQAEAFLGRWIGGDTDAMQQLVSDPDAHVADDLHAAMGSVELSDPQYRFDQITVPTG